MKGRAVTQVLLVGLGLGLVLGAGCSDSPASPSSSGVGGTWVGTLAESGAGSGTGRLILVQTGAGVTGSFQMTFTGGAADRAGSVSGTVAGHTASTFLTPDTPVVCSPGVTLSGTLNANLVVAGSKMTGTYSGLSCAGTTNGTLDLTRQ